MKEFIFHESYLKGAYLIEPFYAGDSRGGFTKIFEKAVYENNNVDFVLSETFMSKSAKNVMRGLHFQFHHPQAKIISVIEGKVWDVIVDLRKGSDTFKCYQTVELSAANRYGLFVPRGFAHGFVSLEDDSIMLYQCDGEYDVTSDSGIRFDEPELGINWPIEDGIAIHSERDLNLHHWNSYCRYIEEHKIDLFGT